MSVSYFHIQFIKGHYEVSDKRKTQVKLHYDRIVTMEEVEI